MKKSCSGCRAFGHTNSPAQCDLGYKIEKFREIECTDEKFYNPLLFKPTEECPKPVTWKRYFELRNSAR